MFWNFLDVLDWVFDILDLFSGNSSYNKDESRKMKKRKYFAERISLLLLAVASIFLWTVLKDPLPVQHAFQTVMITVLIGVFISSACCFALYILDLFYFKSFFSMLLFCIALITFFTAIVLWIYFKSGLF
ncbi:hypothetical protein IQ37_12335 [Chryseobacterium piperi]|uniref:Branched-chain amino acid ABC transporter substrate-binding protein n=1 Tax=Chryseobacterium piperi TaxID=558152 RepID=A0A086B9J3_9FLAO|nr:hypothetical protein [Chryseobacterium piperi]ASW74246.1 branched-chain amino acid ABC transporter substrate-binding protein [Chryseobacterium piperi]KFF25607.1 hypothetical protein IQ37_12335 [Chryseobacterium piperi]